MPEHIVIRLPAHESDPMEVLRVGDAEHGYAVEAISAEDALPLGEGTRVVALVPGEHVLHREAQVPVKGAAKILQTVPFALEEHLAEDVGAMHFAIGKREESGTVPVAAVAADLIEQWVESLAEVGLAPKAMYAEPALLHPPARTAIALLEGERLQLAADGHPPVVDLAENLELLLDTLGAGGQEDGSELLALEEDGESTSAAEEDDDDEAGEASAPTVLTVYGSAQDLADHASLLQALTSRMERIERRELTAGAAPLLAQQAAQEEDAINLLQGAFAPASQLGAVWQQWRVAAVVAGVFVLTLLGGKTAQMFQLRAEDERLKTEIRTTVQDACPEVTTVYDAQRQLQQCLGDSSGPVEQEMFLSMLSTLGSALQDTPNTRIEEVRFARQKMDLKLLAPSVDALDEIKRLVAERGGINLEIEQINPQADQVEFRIELTRPSA